MSEEVQRKVRRWRRLFQSVYFALTIALCVWTLASLLAVRLGLRAPEVKLHRPMIHASGADPAELRSCANEVDALLTDLFNETSSLAGTAIKYKVPPNVEWKDWAAAWRHRWNRTDRRCRLSEVGGTGAVPELDILRQVHEELDQLELGYGEVVDRFLDRFVERLRRLRAEIAHARELIERRRGKKPRASAAFSGATP